MGLCAALLIAAVNADAGTAEPTTFRLSGEVRELGTRDPLAAAHLSCGDVETETDGAGRFVLELPAGERTVRVSAGGYHARDFTESADAGIGVEVVYRLERNTATPYRTTVTGLKARTEAARVALSKAELVDAAGSSGEPLRTVMQLPGVASVASGLAYPVVRGTQPAATGYFVDGVRVPQLFHSLIGLSVLHPDFVEKIDFYPGLPPVPYGRLTGGAVDATVSRPRDGRIHASASIDLINASAFAEAPIEKTGTELTAAGRISYTPLIGAKVAGALLPGTAARPAPTPVADFWDYQTRIGQKLGPVYLRALVFGSYDKAGLVSNVFDTPSGLLDTTFHRADVSARARSGGLQVEAGVTLGTDRVALVGEQNGETVFGLRMNRDLFAARVSATYTFGESLTVRGGVDTEAQRTSSTAWGERADDPDQAFELVRPEVYGVLSSAWLMAQARYGPLETTAGVRGELYDLTNPDQRAFFGVAPRLEQRFRLSDDVAVRAGAGIFYQPPTLLLALPASELSALEQGLQMAMHFEAGADVKLPLGLELGATGFYHPIPRAVEYRVDQLVDPRRELGLTSPATRGRGYGVELFIKRVQEGRWYGWLSATLQRSERSRFVARYDDAGRAQAELVEAQVPFAFDQTFVLNATFGVKLPRGFSAGVSVHFNTGRPEGGDVSSRNMREAVDPRTQSRWWVPQDLDRVDRLPPFFRLDVRVAKTWAFDDFMLELYLDVFNASAGSETLGYTYSVVNPGPSATLQRTAFGLPIILPMLGLKGRY
ncbi:MAG: TonB-dependent receptor [Myxococcaceae bacterium]|nr:TonB-dependent receptor [Myxococcaceae bacterium]